MGEARRPPKFRIYLFNCTNGHRKTGQSANTLYFIVYTVKTVRFINPLTVADEDSPFIQLSV